MKYDWPSIINAIPGYDPYEQAEGFHFDEELAERALEFCRTQLKVWEGKHAGNPFKLLDWQESVMANLFGWVDDNGLRRYREAFIYVAKKNGKSPFVAAIMDYMLLCDGEAGPQVFCAACDTDQANIAYRHAWNMMEPNEGLMAAVKQYIASRTIKYPPLQGFIKVLSSEHKAKDGLNASCVIVDEVHRHDKRDLIDVLMGATSSREQPLTILITTADYDRQSICNDKRKYAEGVRDNAIPDPRFLPVLYQIDPKDDWTDESLWLKANPALGITKSLDYMRRACLKAQNEPGYQSTFRRLECNQMTQSATAWLDLRQWDACNGPWKDDELKGLPCWFGLDLSSTTDLTARVSLWYLKSRDEFMVDCHCWIPELKAHERIKSDQVPYDVWRDKGLVTFTPGNSVDYAFIRDDINEAFTAAKGKEIAMDPWNATQLMTQLAEDDGLPVVEFRQGYASMSPACKELERRVAAGTIRHNGNQLLRWMVGNCMTKADPAGNIKVDKEKSSQRIDAVVGMVMALGRAVLEVNKKSVYETRGIRSL
jgi:phage terminase large subunit-like protein